MIVHTKIICESLDQAQRLIERLDRPDDWSVLSDVEKGIVTVEADARKGPLLAKILFDFAMGSWPDPGI